MKAIKLLSCIALISVLFLDCSKDDEFLNDYEVEITFNGEISEFIQTLSVSSARNDGNGNFVGEALLFKDSGEIAPTFFSTQDLEVGTYRFVTARKAEDLQINYNNVISSGVNSATMSINVVVKRDGSTIDNFSLSYDELTGDESFSVSYNSDNSGFRCYCAVNCNQLLGPGGLGPALPCD